LARFVDDREVSHRLGFVELARFHFVYRLDLVQLHREFLVVELDRDLAAELDAVEVLVVAVEVLVLLTLSWPFFGS
jgi:hypothetical protein